MNLHLNSRGCSVFPTLNGLVLLIVVSLVNSSLDRDGVCSLVAFLPYTIVVYNESDYLLGFSEFGQNTITGFSHMAAALLAEEHFNARNTAVVPELADLTKDCNVTLDLGQGPQHFIDTGSLVRTASQRLHLSGIRDACAFVGPFNDYPAVDLSIMAQAQATPIIVARNFHPRVCSNFLSRYASCVYPDLTMLTESLVGFLRHKGRTDYISFLFSISETNVQRNEYLAIFLDVYNMTLFSSAFINGFADYSTSALKRSAFDALERIKQRGFRTIVVAMENWFEIFDIAEAAAKLGMDNGDYLWIWHGPFDHREHNPTVRKLIEGSAKIEPVSSEVSDPENSPFLLAWRSQGAKAVDRLNSLNPIARDAPGYAYANTSFFLDVPPESDSARMYDAVMSVGIGACLALQNENSTVISGEAHVDAIRSVEFTGATGPVRYGHDVHTDKLGIRSGSTVALGVYNVRFSETASGNVSSYMELTDMLSAGAPPNDWKQVQPFVYRDGRTIPPQLLRDKPDQNYLSPALQVLGLSMMGISMLLSLVCAFWIFVCREHRILKASQPVFLYLICFGTLMQAAAIFTISFDESDGWSSDSLGSLCMAMPWLVTIGTSLVYGALFSKLWRLNRVLQFSRRKVSMQSVAWPMLSFAAVAVVILILWTALEPLEWNRTEIEETTGESIGLCNQDGPVVFATILSLFLFLPAAMTGFIAWKTRDVDETYSESGWIFLMILVQLEIMLVSVPIVIILRGVSTDGRYLGFTFLLLLYPFSTLLTIMLPKFIAWRRAQKEQDSNAQYKRGQHQGLRVSGFPASNMVRIDKAISSTSADPSQTPANGRQKESTTSIDPPSAPSHNMMIEE